MVRICFRKKTMPMGTTLLEQMSDYLLWYAKSIENVKYRPLYLPKTTEGDLNYRWFEDANGMRSEMTKDQIDNHKMLPPDSRVYHLKSLEPSGVMDSGRFPFEFRERTYPSPKNGWATTPEGMQRLKLANRLEPLGDALRYVLYEQDYPVTALTNPWNDLSWSGFSEAKIYVVQTNSQAVKRCLLMTTDPGDLVMDPTCGSGTTAYVAEQWGRRWITIDTSHVPLALARQRLLTATFSYYELKDPDKGPAGGFVYKRKQNNKGEEVGGIVPHVTLKSIANNEPPDEEVLVDRPEIESGITRVTGPLVVEATIPTPVDFDADNQSRDREGADKTAVTDEYADYTQRMLEVLRKAPVLRLPGNRTVTFKNVRQPAKTLSLSAEALVDNGKVAPASSLAPSAAGDGGATPVAFVFGPENGAVSEKLVFNSAKEANGKGYSHLYVLGFAIQPNAREMIDNCADAVGIPATYVQATPDIAMGDLLKNQRSSQVFSVCELPEVKLVRLKRKGDNGELLYRVELLGLDSYDPVDGSVDHSDGSNVPCWMLDTDYNELCFHAGQVFFPRTSAWDNLKRALKGTYEDSVWEHLAGTVSEPFPAPAGENKQIAVKVIDDRGNELMVVKKLDEAESE